MCVCVAVWCLIYCESHFDSWVFHECGQFPWFYWRTIVLVYVLVVGMHRWVWTLRTLNRAALVLLFKWMVGSRGGGGFTYGTYKTIDPMWSPTLYPCNAKAPLNTLTVDWAAGCSGLTVFPVLKMIIHRGSVVFVDTNKHQKTPRCFESVWLSGFGKEVQRLRAAEAAHAATISCSHLEVLYTSYAGLECASPQLVFHFWLFQTD